MPRNSLNRNSLIFRYSSRLIALTVATLFFLAALPPGALAIPAKVALLHTFPVLGDVATNVVTLEELVEEAFIHGANIIVTPELATTGFAIKRPDVLTDLGFNAPYAQLDGIRDLAIEYEGYIVIAFAEVTDVPGQTFNSLALFGPEGLIDTERKRSLSGWHDLGDTPHDVIETPYGDIGFMICSDSYLPDWTRILALKGADLVLLPANWWGSFSPQFEIWQTRAKENNIWFFTANRWGEEDDVFFGFPITYLMYDAPSAFITPDGEIQQIYRAQDVPSPVDEILYYTVNVPEERIGGLEGNPNYSLQYRAPSAYQAIGNQYYRNDLPGGSVFAPGLPPLGTTRIATIAYRPTGSAADNVATIEEYWNSSGESADLIVLPGLGISSKPINSANSGWFMKDHWQDLQNFVEGNGIRLLATTVYEVGDGKGKAESVLILQPNTDPILARQIHDTPNTRGSGVEPIFIDIDNARVSFLTGRDLLFPEAATASAKLGADILVVPSAVGADDTSGDATNEFWERAALQRLWRTRSNHVYHVAATDWTGHGTVINVTGGIIGNFAVSDEASPVAVIDTVTNDDPFAFDSVRFKFLNSYYSFDLDTLIGN